MADSVLNLTIIKNYSLCIWDFRYWLPDAPSLMAPEFRLQEYDLAPEFPELRKFINFWHSNLDGKLHSVRVATHPLISPKEFRIIGNDMRLH